MTAGKKCAPALPEVAITATGVRVRRAIPKAKNAAERSSSTGVAVTFGLFANAKANGAERDPGEITA